jgi:hypothetical protein
MLTIWADHHIEDGEQWVPKIVAAIRKTDLAICLVSPDYLRSDYCMNVELPCILKKNREESLSIMFVHVETCNYRIYDWVKDEQLSPSDGKSLAYRSKKTKTIFLQTSL